MAQHANRVVIEGPFTDSNEGFDYDREHSRLQAEEQRATMTGTLPQVAFT